MNKPIKVLHVIYALSGGGAERQLQLLLKYAPARTVHGVLCVEPRDIDLASLEAEVFVHKRKGKFDFGLYVSCFKTIKCFQPDIVHLWLPPVITIPAMLSAVLQNKPVIFSYRRKMQFYRLLSIVEFVLALFCVTKVISNNKVCQSANYYQFLYNSKTGTTISNGLDFSAIQKKTDHEVKVDKPVTMIFVGRLVQEKNLLNLIRALVFIPEDKQWTLDVFGEGNLKKEALDLVNQLNLADRIVFHGFNKSIYLRLIKNDLLLMPSNTEGMPNVLVEALAANIPVVASNISSIVDIVGDSGAAILVDPQNVESIARGIMKYIDNQDSFIRNTTIGLNLAKKFDVELMSNKYGKEYKRLLKAG